jgi:uncharacterized lipoprotein NlpE involved in copper resistance
MKRAFVLLALVLLVLLGACRSETPVATDTQSAAKPQTPPPTIAQAKELIASSAELGEFEFTNSSFTTPVDLATASAPVQASAKELEEAGWIQIERGKVELTDKSKTDKRFLMRANGILDVIPLAKKEMGDVTSVEANADGTASAQFGWRWVANEVGVSFKTGMLQERFATPRTSKATLIWDGTSWSVLKIE